ncbi:adhesion G-protein coupled receptor G6-like isoform X13 [Oncorhynchus keta]|uniref:adhesion G-protein coupled receptor G6-like isoform X11 n=1 Tax=Oncorhynchus keta TaxID=8018 RepID=UPI00227B669B|nr:adhesion G-protein coupled receptor G6-like isoform X11 [Oncorhynchus keta]XP_052379607.1 adhesion G-protein coupled receptor G6-like isoform X12 [Oncorhynchus keta]XP_052379608.1 adhesion G-protein coupled receptor G6-like isoform X13 [Oncorhynchus keta]
MESYICGGWWRWKFRNVLPVALLLMSLQRQAVLSCSNSNCVVVLKDSQGEFNSPCYPQDYPSSQACKWTLQAPAGFIVQITFSDFELEEALGCIYDRIIVNTGNQDVKFCGLTAKGLTLNSTGNVMEVSFNSDFSVQKKGFSVSYRQVAVALRNQKVTVSNGAGKVVQVSNSVTIPTLQQFTVCFEIARPNQKSKETIFSYTRLEDSSGEEALSFGNNQDGMALVMSNETCLIDSILNASDFTSTMKQFCLTWASTTGKVTLYFNSIYRVKTCSNTIGHSVGAGGLFRLGSHSSFDGTIYNFRLWNYAMDMTQLVALTCDAVGNVIDWDNSFWDIPSSLAQTDSALSCICFPHCIHLTTAAPSSGTSVPVYTSQTTSCASPGLGCPATLTSTSSSIVTTNMIATNSTTHVLSATTSSATTTSMPLTTSSSTEGLFYRISFVVNDKEAKLTESDVEKTVAQWLNQTFQNWTHVVYVDNFRIQPNSDSQLKRSASKKFTCQALLVYQTSTNVTLEEVAISTRMVGSSPNIGNGLELETVNVQSVENCPEETPLHYIWPESRPTVTQYVPCFPNKDQTASRTCVISPLNYTAFWGAPDISNCTDIDSINVSAENAAEVADQLADITNNELSTDEVFKVVGKVKELVNVAKINTTLATTVLNIISNVMTSSVSALAVASERTLKTVDELVQKLEFDGPSVSITSKNLALGISTLNHGKFNGTSFSAFIQPNTTDLQIDFESNQLNPLAQVTLPATLLKNLTDAETAAISRINFMFFSKIGLFQDKQDGMSLNSYVVASSVGNYSISNLQDPVEIEIVHLNYQPKPKPTCMFWDFTMKNDSGGWNSKGCRVSPMSNGNKTICLCDHLTHFGILMDISGSAAQIDEKNTKILTFITYIGCGISAIFSAVTLLTYIAFEKLRRDYPSKILMNLSTSLLFLNMVFLLDGWLASFEMEGLCVAVAVFLHFFLLTSFTWMGLESIHMYIALVKVFNTYIRRYILKFCIVGWGLPAAIVATVVAIDKNSYGKMEYGKGDTGQGSSEFCWIRSHVVFYVTCVGYFSVIFLLNVAMFIVVMIQICGRNGKRSNRTLREEVLRNLRSVISLTFLLGMTWGFAFFAWGPVNLAFMYLFSISNSLQGLFIFIFHCALKENVQKQWRRYLCCGRFRLADNSDWSKTATNNTKKVSSDTVGKSLSSSSFGSSTANWTSKAKATLNPFAKRNSNAGKGYSNQTNPKSVSLDGEASSSSSSIIPVHQVIDKVKGYCSARSDNFYKNIIMSDSFSHSTKF